jgi:hypothetical protein
MRFGVAFPTQNPVIFCGIPVVMPLQVVGTPTHIAEIAR